MGLFLAKEYIKNEKRGLPLEYRGIRITLQQNEQYLCPENEYIELIYTGDEIKISYGNNERLIINASNGKLSLKFTETDKKSTDKRTFIYPLTTVVSEVNLFLINR